MTDTLVEEGPYGSIHKLKNCFALYFQIDTTGDGFADDTEVETFDTLEQAREYAILLCQGERLK